MAQTDARHRLPYLPALDGLRGAAVAVVVAFHAHWLTGGYLGVDLFFVLSGFLITRLLLDEYSTTGRIDLIEFWKRRARRLLPALLAVTLFAAIAERMRGTLDGASGGRRDVIGALTYASNWLRLDGEAGYWRRFGRPALLDHTWSLAIEEQFYVAWPLLLLAVLWLVRRHVGRVVVLALASGGLALWALHVFSATSDANRVYMGTDTRAVALLLGATVAAIASRRSPQSNNKALRIVALPALIALSIMCVRMRGDALLTYEGGLIAFSLAGAIVVAAGSLRRPAGVFRVFTTSPLRWLGTRSYGIYLWHWPIMVGLRVAAAPTSAPWRRLAAIAITLVVAEISYRFIEQPIRQQGLQAFRHPARTAAVGFATVALSLAVVLVPEFNKSTSAAVPLPTAVPTSGPPDTTSTSTGDSGDSATTSVVTESTLPTPPAHPVSPLPDGRPPRVMFVGDSVGWELADQAEAEQLRLGVEIANEARIGCPLMDAPLSRRNDASSVPLVFKEQCYEVVRAYGDTTADVQPDVVIMVFGASFLGSNEIAPGEWHEPCTAPFDSWLKGQIRRSVDALSSTGATIYWATPAYYRGEVDHRTPVFDDQVDCLNEVAREVAAQSNGVMGVLELGQWACPTRECLTEREGFSLRPDGYHFVDEGASLANIWMLAQVFDPPPWLREP